MTKACGLPWISHSSTQMLACSMSKADGRVGISTRSATTMPGSIRSTLAGPVSMKTHSHPSAMSSSIASVVASISCSFGFLVRPRRVHQLARLSCGSRSSSATRLLSSAARTASALQRVDLPTPPFTLAKVTTRSRGGGCLGAIWYQPGRCQGRALKPRVGTNSATWYLARYHMARIRKRAQGQRGGTKPSFHTSAPR